ncbi:MAG: thioesterase family protein [Nocardioides sp.]
MKQAAVMVKTGAPLRLHSCIVLPEWVDYNGHMSESCYLLVVGDSSDAFFRCIGIDEAYRAAGHSLYTVETHLHHRREASLGDALDFTLQVLDHDSRRIHLFHQVIHAASGEVAATAEQMLVHVDMAAGRTAPMPGEMLERVAAIDTAHRGLPAPEGLSQPMKIRRRDT